ncbi:MAG: twin-arginine translocase subunit TatC [Actinomycetota bacterium]
MAEASDLRRRRLRFLRRRRVRPKLSTMSVVEHLDELRSRLIFSGVAFLAISVAAFFFYEPVLDFLTKPLCELPQELRDRMPQGCRLVFMRVIGGFLFRLKVTTLVAIIFSSPVWLYQIWAFVTPGLTSKERRYALPFVASSVTLFAIGTAAAYLSLPTGIRVLVSLAGNDLVPFLGAEEYLNFVGLMLLGFGITFEVPLVLFFLGLVGVITVEQLRRQRKVALVSIVALAAIVTPSQDPYTLLVLAVPIYLLYELTIVLLGAINRRRARTKSV